MAIPSPSDFEVDKTEGTRCILILESKSASQFSPFPASLLLDHDLGASISRLPNQTKANHPVFCSSQTHVYMNLAISLASELGLDNDLPNSLSFTPIDTNGLIEGGVFTPAAKSAYLGCYCLSSA